MKSLVRALALGCAVSLLLTAPASAGKPPELSPTELAGLQSHSYAAPPKVAFNAALATLQSLGYVDIQANRDAGTIGATTDTKAHTIYNIFWGFGKKKYTMKASLLVEEYGAGSLVRLNLLVSETKARGIFGTSFTDGQIVRYGDPYRDFFGIMDREVERRAANASAAVVSGPSVPSGDGIRLVPANTPSGYCIAAPADYVGTGSASRPSVTEARPLCRP